MGFSHTRHNYNVGKKESNSIAYQLDKNCHFTQNSSQMSISNILLVILVRLMVDFHIDRFTKNFFSFFFLGGGGQGGGTGKKSECS